MELNNSLLFNNYFTNLNASVVNQLDTLKSHKFLYNYSFLHRKILKDFFSPLKDLEEQGHLKFLFVTGVSM